VKTKHFVTHVIIKTNYRNKASVFKKTNAFLIQQTIITQDYVSRVIHLVQDVNKMEHAFNALLTYLSLGKIAVILVQKNIQSKTVFVTSKIGLNTC